MNEEIIIANTKRCPKCGWETNNEGFTSTIKGCEGNWCMACWVKKTTKGIPRLEEIKSKSNDNK